MAYTQLQFESKYLRGNTTVSLILPDLDKSMTPAEFYGSGKKYKVLWLLHGTFGDHSDWIRKSNIELYACEREMMVVMPSAMNSNYANWPDFSIGYYMYDFLFQELMPLIYGWYPASAKREDNFIAGLSMGGRGTCVYALSHPEKFGGAAVLSACPRNLEILPQQEPDMWKRTQGSIKNAGGLEAYLASPENTWERMEEVFSKGELPPFYFATGTDDVFYPAFETFRRHAEERGYPITFEEIPGYGHEWRFWDLTIEKALDFFNIPKKVVDPATFKPW